MEVFLAIDKDGNGMLTRRRGVQSCAEYYIHKNSQRRMKQTDKFMCILSVSILCIHVHTYASTHYNQYVPGRQLRHICIYC